MYLFTPDGQGESVCYDQCEAAWPPVSAAMAAGETSGQSKPRQVVSPSAPKPKETPAEAAPEAEADSLVTQFEQAMIDDEVELAIEVQVRRGEGVDGGLIIERGHGGEKREPGYGIGSAHRTQGCDEFGGAGGVSDPQSVLAEPVREERRGGGLAGVHARADDGDLHRGVPSGVCTATSPACGARRHPPARPFADLG